MHCVLGNIRELSRKAAENQADLIRRRLNAEQYQPTIWKFGEVAADYVKQELESERSRLAFSTREVYAINIRRWIFDRWEKVPLENIRGADVECWLDSNDATAPTWLLALFRQKGRSRCSLLFLSTDNERAGIRLYFTPHVSRKLRLEKKPIIPASAAERMRRQSPGSCRSDHAQPIHAKKAGSFVRSDKAFRLGR